MLEVVQADLRGILLVVISLLLWLLLNVLYNLVLHPLACFPGPFLWRSTRLAYMYSLWSGQSHNEFQSLHEKYGPVIRVAPNELSFADPAAWEGIYSNRGASGAFPKSAVWHAAQNGKARSIVNCLDKESHTRMRRKMEPGFSERAVMSQENIIQGYVTLLIRKLKQNVTLAPLIEGDREAAIVDVSKWLTFISLDIVGDLCFGESFGCLERSEMNSWMALLFGSLKAQVFIATLRHYTWVTWLLERLIPKSAKESVEQHWRIVEDKVDKRLKRATSRPDFIELWQRDGKVKDGLTKNELCANSFMMMFAGSETVATSLAGTLNLLVKSPEKLAVLREEIRTRVAREEDLTLSSLKDLPYLNAVIWEGYRMCTPFPLGFARISPPEGAIVSGYYVPGNTFVSISFQALFLDLTRFHEAKRFRPERWLPEAYSDPSSPFYHDDRSAVQPFSIGPRQCIGRPLAIAESRLILARLVWAFDIEKAETEAGNLIWESQKTFTLVEKQPLEIKLVLRN